jgi:prevent-host-death family protein
LDKHPNTWTLQEAKARFSEVVRRAKTEGPQKVTLHGRPAVVISDVSEGNNPTLKQSVWQAIQQLKRGPGIDFDLPPRPKSSGKIRKVDLP